MIVDKNVLEARNQLLGRQSPSLIIFISFLSLSSLDPAIGILIHQCPPVILRCYYYSLNQSVTISVADPDPHVFGTPGSGSTGQRYGSGSGSFHHHAKIVRKTFIPTF